MGKKRAQKRGAPGGARALAAWMKERRALLASLAAIMLLSLAGFGQLLAPGKIPYSADSDLVTWNLAAKASLFASTRAGGGIPAWRDDQLSGYPAIANPHTTPFFPLHLPFWLAPPEEAAGPVLWLTFLAAALCFYCLGAALGLGAGARLFMAAAGLFDFKMIVAAHAGWLTYTAAVAVLPLVLGATVALVRSPSAGRAALLAAALGAFLLSGHLQHVYYGLLLAGALAAAMLAGSALRRGPWGRAALWGGCAALVGAAVAAAAYLPLAGELGLLSRGSATYDLFLNRHAFAARHLLTFLHPHALGSALDGTYRELWEDAAYFGVVPLLLALFGAARGWRRPGVLFLAAAMILSLLLAVDTPLLELFFRHVPGFRFFRGPSRLLFVTATAGIALAGVGFEELSALLKRRAARPARATAAAAAILLLVVTAEGTYWARRYVACEPRERVWPQADGGAFLGLRETPEDRVLPLGRSTINYGWAARLGLRLAAGYDPYNYVHYGRYFDMMTEGRPLERPSRVWFDAKKIARRDLLDALGVGWVVTTAPLEPLPPQMELAARSADRPLFVFYRGMQKGELLVYRNGSAAAPAFWAHEVLAARTPRDEVRLVQAADARRSAVVLDEAGRAPLKVVLGPPGPADSVEVKERRPGRLALAVRAGKRRFVVAGEVWHPGWRATLDGAPLPLARADLALLGAWVPPGAHRVVLEFVPPLRREGLLVSAAGLLALLALAALAFLLRRRAAANAPPAQPR